MQSRRVRRYWIRGSKPEKGTRRSAVGLGYPWCKCLVLHYHFHYVQKMVMFLAFEHDMIWFLAYVTYFFSVCYHLNRKQLSNPN